jgi:hypothetical protein
VAGRCAIHQTPVTVVSVRVRYRLQPVAVTSRAPTPVTTVPGPLVSGVATTTGAAGNAWGKVRA